MSSAAASSPGRPLDTLLAVAAALLVALLFFRLGAHPLMETSDARYAEIAWEMVYTGDWLSPHMNFALHLDKPPLAYWLGALGLKLLGHSEYAVRTPLAVAALLCLGLVYLTGRWLFGKREALLACLILGTAPLFLFMGRLFTTDLYLCLFVVAAHAAFLRGYAEPRPRLRWRLAFALALALGFLTKGPVVLLHTVAPILLFHTVWGERGRLAPFFSPLPLAAFVGVAAPWFVAVGLAHPEVWGFYLHHELVARVSGNALNRRQPFYYFLPILLAGLAPWSLWLPGLVRGPAREVGWSRLPVAGVQRLLACWLLLPLVVLSLVRSKLPPYVLPLLPAAALWGGACLAPWLEQPWRRLPRLLPLLLPVVAGILAVAGLLAYRDHVEEWTVSPMGPVIACFWVAIAALVTIAVTVRARRRAATLVAVLVFALSFDLMGIYQLPNTKPHYRFHRLARELAGHLAPEDTVLTYSRYLRGLPFYLQRPVSVARYPAWEHPLDRDPTLGGRHLEHRDQIRALFHRGRRVWVILEARALPQLREDAAVPLYEWGRQAQYRLLCTEPPPGSAGVLRPSGEPGIKGT